MALSFSTALQQFTQDAQGVSIQVQAADGGCRQLRARYLVGADGGSSTVRTALGIRMEGDRLPQRWLVVDTVDSHLNDEPHCRFYCDPARPAMTMLRPRGERRWEWMLLDHESDEHMLADTTIDALLEPHTDRRAVQVYRKAVYGFSAVTAQLFSVGRVFIAGDAAHMTPPFAGQGLNLGIRDVRNLSWKLGAVVRGELPETLLATYQLERHDAARDLINLALALGDQIQPTDIAAAEERDAFFRELNAKPEAIAGFCEDMTAPLRDVRLSGGWYSDDVLAGRLIPQPYVHDSAALLDDLIAPGFVALVPPGSELPSAITVHSLWRQLSPQLYDMPSELQGFVDDLSRIVVLRPDRFVLLSFTDEADGIAALDDLQHSLV